MIDRLVQSALQTGCLSVESEALIRQILAIRGYQQADLKAIEQLKKALRSGKIQREARGDAELLPADSSTTVSRLSGSNSRAM